MGIQVGIPSVWHPGGPPTSIEILSKPLSLEEIYEMDQALSPSDIAVYWSIDAYGFLREEYARKYGLDPGSLVHINVSSGRTFIITRQEFVRNVLQPADMLKRVFIEVAVESLDSKLLDRIADVDVREALRILLEKQKMLQEALSKLYRASRASEYRDVIDEVRRSFEGIICDTSAGKRVARALTKALKSLGIVHEIESGALDELIEEVKRVILGGEGLTQNIFSYASKLGVHGKTLKTGKLYEPRPYKRDAEFIVLQAMLVLNYLIKVLKHYALRT